MGDIEKRIEALEKLYASEAGGGGGQGRDLRTREFLTAFLQALARVRRAPIDPPERRYRSEDLYALSPLGLAAYTAALQVLEHPDAAEARDLLLGVGDERLVRLVDEVLDRVRRSKGRDE